MNRFFIFLSILLFTATGCNKESSIIDNAPYASVSVYAVTPDASDFNFFLNGDLIAASVPFGSYTLYNKVKAGTVALRVQSASRNISIDTSFSADVDQYYSLFITGNASKIKPVALHDPLPSLTTNSVGLRFLVFSPGVSNIDFHVVNTDTATVGSWLNRSYGDNIISDSINTFTKFAAGTYSFYAVSRQNNKDTLAKFTNQTFSDSSNYTLMLEGHLTDSDTSLLLGTRLHN